MKPTNPLWYLVAFVIALGSTMIAAVVAAQDWDPVRDASVTPLAQRIDTSGKSVAVFTDIVQPDRKVTCSATGPGKKVVQIPAAKFELTNNDGGDQWHLIAVLKHGEKDQRITCTPRDRRVDDATYTYAAITASKENTANGIAALGLALGLALAAYTFYCSRQKRRSAPE